MCFMFIIDGLQNGLFLFCSLSLALILSHSVFLFSAWTLVKNVRKLGKKVLDVIERKILCFRFKHSTHTQILITPLTHQRTHSMRTTSSIMKLYLINLSFVLFSLYSLSLSVFPSFFLTLMIFNFLIQMDFVRYPCKDIRTFHIPKILELLSMADDSIRFIY